MKMVVWDITDKCNLRCKHCYNADMYFNNKVQQLKVNDKINIVKKLSKLGFNYLDILGGEPLCCENLDLILHTAKENNIGVEITTNGTLLNEKMIDILIKNNVKNVHVSLDGSTRAINDAIRGKGSFDKATSNLKKLTQIIKENNSNMLTSISTTLTKFNINDLKNMPKLANDLGVNILIYTAFVESGNGDRNSNIFKEDYNKIQDAIEEIAKEEFKKYPNITFQLDMKPYLTNYLKRRYNIKNLIFVKSFTKCNAGEDIWYVTADGYLHPCNILINQNVPQTVKDLIPVQYVNLLECTDFDDIESNKYFSSFMNLKNDVLNKQVKKTCANCELINDCNPCPILYKDKSVIEECEYRGSAP
ncbi:radical SAM protein [Haloimpatiens sp. FM7315]|uniref:radical SAM protein n=1 Tax=Haloimpatiens sp. FM7315 TaxID=3298609 RepID=UPI0035A3C4DB